jgi:hypothetical protein
MFATHLINTTMNTLNIYSHLLPGHSSDNDQIVEIFSNQFLGQCSHYMGFVNFPDDCPNLTDIHIYNIKVMRSGYGNYVWTLDVHFCFGKNRVEKDYSSINNYSEVYDAFKSEDYGSEDYNEIVLDAFKSILFSNIGKIVEDVIEIESEIEEFNQNNQ